MGMLRVAYLLSDIATIGNPPKSIFWKMKILQAARNPTEYVVDLYQGIHIPKGEKVLWLL